MIKKIFVGLACLGLLAACVTAFPSDLTESPAPTVTTRVSATSATPLPLPVPAEIQEASPSPTVAGMDPTPTAAQPAAAETTQPTLRETPLQLPTGLMVEEYALVGAPRTEPRSFRLVEGAAAGIFTKHPVSEREQFPDHSYFRDMHFSWRVQLGAAELTAIENYSQNGRAGWVSVESDGTEIYRIETGPGSPMNALRGLWAYDDHWVLETAQISQRQEGNTIYTDAVGQLTQDGELLNIRYKYAEMFGFQTLAGRPFYFFTQDGKIGFSYEGQTVMAGYDVIPHYGCCSAAELNPYPYTNMVAFFAQMDGQWFYVEIGVYE